MLRLPSVKFPSNVSDLGSCTVRPTSLFLFPVELVKAIEGMVPHVVDMLKDKISCDYAVTVLGKISKQRK